MGWPSVRLLALVACVACDAHPRLLSASNVSEPTKAGLWKSVAKDDATKVDAARSRGTSRRKFMRLGFAAGAVIAYFGTRGNKTWEDAPADFIISFPMRYMHGGAYVEMDVGEFSVLRLLIDSSAIKTVITAAASLRAGVKPYTERITLRSRGWDGFTLHAGVTTPVQPPPDGIDGVLGMDMMLRYAAVEFDWEEGLLRLHPARWHEPPDLQIRTLPMQLTETLTSKLPFVDATFSDASGGRDGKNLSVQALVDTGSEVTEVTPAFSQLARGVLGAPSEEVVNVSSGINPLPVQMRISTYEKLRIGKGSFGAEGCGVTHERGRVYVGASPMMHSIDWEGTPAALLGLDVLQAPGLRRGQRATPLERRKGALILDFARLRLVLVLPVV